MENILSREIHLRNRPVGLPEEGDFALVEVPVPEPGEGQSAHLRYHRDPGPALDNVDRGAGNLVLLLNRTRIDQVKAYAERGIKMPAKSTDFYPKMVAGLTLMPIGPNDEMGSVRAG